MRYFLTVLTTTLMAWHSHAQVAMIILDKIPGEMKVCVTNYGPTIAAAELSIGVVSGRVSAIEGQVIKWNTAYGWGDHHQQGYATTQDVAKAIADMPPVVIPDETDPVFAAWLDTNPLTEEQDLAALRLYHYGDTEIVESPADWFVFDGAGTITGYNYVAGREDVVIPWEIGGVPVSAIGDSVFTDPMVGSFPIKTVIAPKTVTSIGGFAFSSCYSLTSIDFPAVTLIGDYAFVSCTSLISVDFRAVTSIGDSAFGSCYSLTSVDFRAVTSIGDSAFGSCYSLTSIDFHAVTSIGDSAFYYCPSLTSITIAANAPTVGTGAFSGTDANLVITVTDPQATGWGATLSDGSTAVPVVRPDLYADAFHGSGAALTGVTKPADLTAQYSAWTTNVVSSGTNVINSAWGNQPRLELNGNAVIDFDLGTASSGLHRLTLSLWSGTNSVAWLTNNVDFAETPDLETDAYNTILIRKIGSAKAEGRQL